MIDFIDLAVSNNLEVTLSRYLGGLNITLKDDIYVKSNTFLEAENYSAIEEWIAQSLKLMDKRRELTWKLNLND